jgi:hypothetical protein
VADRTGKSYILNQLASAPPGAGFDTGSSVQACTKGIWLWAAPRAPTTQPGAPDHLLLLDTEGLSSICATEGHDAKIFCLAILLSTLFIVPCTRSKRRRAAIAVAALSQRAD